MSLHFALVFLSVATALDPTSLPASGGKSIEDFGAVAGIDTHDQALVNGIAFAKAVAFANASLTDRSVLIPNGRVYSFLPSTPCFESVADLTVQWEGTFNLFTKNFSKAFPGFPNPWNPVCFRNAKRLSIVSGSGEGILNGRGNVWWWYTIFVGDHRSTLLTVDGGTDTLIDGITLLNAPKFHFGLWSQQNLIVRRTTVRVDVEDQLAIYGYIGGSPLGASPVDVMLASGRAGPIPPQFLAENRSVSSVLAARLARLPTHLQNEPWWDNAWGENPPFPMVYALNTDGIDFTGRNISVHNCTVTNFDDSVCVKPLILLTDGHCTRDVDIHDIKVVWGVGVSLGSVPPDNNHRCIDNVTARNLHFTTPLKAIYIKPNPAKPPPATGSITNILYEDVVVEYPVWFAIWIGPQQQHQPGGRGTDCSFLFPLKGFECVADPEVTVANITIRRMRVSNTLMSPGVLLMNSSNPGEGFVFDDVVYTNVTAWPMKDANFYCANVNGVATGGTSPIPPCFKVAN